MCLYGFGIVVGTVIHYLFVPKMWQTHRFPDRKRYPTDPVQKKFVSNRKELCWQRPSDWDRKNTNKMKENQSWHFIGWTNEVWFNVCVCGFKDILKVSCLFEANSCVFGSCSILTTPNAVHILSYGIFSRMPNCLLDTQFPLSTIHRLIRPSNTYVTQLLPSTTHIQILAHHFRCCYYYMYHSSSQLIHNIQPYYGLLSIFLFSVFLVH